MQSATARFGIGPRAPRGREVGHAGVTLLLVACGIVVGFLAAVALGWQVAALAVGASVALLGVASVVGRMLDSRTEAWDRERLDA